MSKAISQFEKDLKAFTKKTKQNFVEMVKIRVRRESKTNVNAAKFPSILEQWKNKDNEAIAEMRSTYFD